MSKRINTLAENIKNYIDHYLFNARVSIPASIVSYDATTQTASVKILIKEKYKVNDNEFEKELVIPDVLVILPASSSTCYMSFPLASGSLGELHFSDRSLSNYIDKDGTESVSIDNDYRSHDMSFAYFTPGLRPIGAALSGKDSDALHLRNADSSIKMYDDGTMEIENGTDELINILYDLVNLLTTATVITGIGPQTFTGGVVTSLTTIKNKLNGFKV